MYDYLFYFQDLITLFFYHIYRFILYWMLYFWFAHRDTDIHGGQKSRSEGPGFSHNHSVGVSSFSSSPAGNHRRTSSHVTVGTSPPNMHSDGMSVDDEDSVDFDFDRYQYIQLFFNLSLNVLEKDAKFC